MLYVNATYLRVASLCVTTEGKPLTKLMNVLTLTFAKSRLGLTFALTSSCTHPTLDRQVGAKMIEGKEGLTQSA